MNGAILVDMIGAPHEFDRSPKTKEYQLFSKHFLEAANLARNNEKNAKGIGSNAFSESFVVPVDLFDMIAEMQSSFEMKEETENE